MTAAPEKISIEFDEISKRFPGVLALDRVSFGIEGGRVRGLVGENGAGKSTLLKILSGAYQPSGGVLRIQGRPVRFRSTAEAIEAGIAVIYQELQLVPEMTVAENLFLGHLPGRFGIVARKALRSAAFELLAKVDESISPDIKVGRLSIAQRQMVEIAKALSRGARILAFDEPTSSLSEPEVRKLFQIIRTLREQGCAVLYVSHRLEEIFEICDGVTVLRDGRLVETFEGMAGLTAEVVVNRMVGRDITDIYGYRPREHSKVRLEVRGLFGPGLSAPASFSVSGGEIVGMFGLVGAGRSELLRLVYGAARPLVSGEVFIDGEPVVIRTPADAIRAGMVFCPEDRKLDGIIGIRSVLENLNISARRHAVGFGGILDLDWERQNAEKWIQELNIRTPSPLQLIRNLSGGNQQKAILGRWLSETPRVFLLDEPTRGIDVGSKSEIYALMYRLAEAGMAVVMVSSELPELLGVTDRILVMREGRITGEVPHAQATEESVLRLALPGGAESREAS